MLPVPLVMQNKPLGTTPEFMLIKVTLGGVPCTSPAWGLDAQGPNPTITGLELSASREGRRAADLSSITNSQ